VIFALSPAATLAFAGFGSGLAGASAVNVTLFSVTSILILGPVAFVLLSWLGTMALTRRPPRLKAPMLQALGLVSCLALALPALAAMYATARARAGHSSQWWVGAWHQLLLGVATFGIRAAVYYRAPQPSGPPL